MAILFVQSQQALATTGTVSATYSRTPITGNLLVAFYVCNSNNLTTAPTITGWTALTPATTSTNSRAERMFYKIAGNSEPTSVTVTGSTGTSHLTVLEYSGIDPLNPLLVENNALPTTTTSTTYTTPTVTPATGVGALVIAGVMQKNNDTTLFTTHQINGSANGVSVRSNAHSQMKSPATVFDATVTSTSGTYVGTATRPLAAAAGGGAIAIFRAATTPGKILAYENWTGSDGDAWPSQWTTMANGATDGTAAIQSNAGRLTSSTAGYAYGGRRLSGVSSYNQRLVIDVNAQGDGTEQYIYVAMRSNGAIGDYYPASDYYIKVPFYEGPSDAEFGIHGNNEYAIGDHYKFAGATASSTFHIDATIFNNQVTLYAWAGSTKPSTPTYTFTDPNYTLYSAGTIALYQSNGSTGVAHNATFDTMLLTTGLELTNTTAPTISGSAYTSSVLTVSNGAWSDTPDSYLYQWYRDGITIAGATANTYTVTADDTGTKLSVLVQTVKAEYKNGGAFSNSVNAAGQGINNTALPTITGTAAVGNTLTATNGSWSQVPDSYTYQWNRSGLPISGATGQTYSPVNADINAPITVTVNAVKATYANGTATSNSVTPVAGTTVTNTALPVISGTAVTGQTVTVSNGSWSSAPDSYAYQWYRDGSAIAGATNAAYILTILDRGLPVTATVTATKGAGTTPATSSAITSQAAVISDRLAYWHNALTNRASAPATFVAMGGLTTEGQGATNRGSRWISRLRDALRRNYRTTGTIGGEGYVPGAFKVNDFSASWTNWLTSGTGSYQYDEWSADLGYRIMSLGESSSVTYTFIGTDIDIWYTTGFGAFTYAIDNGTGTHVDSSGTYSTSQYVSVTGLAAGTHTVKISTAAGENATIDGFFIFNGDKAKGIRLADAGHTGYTLNNYTGDYDHFTISIDTTNPSLITIEVGSYDAVAYTPAVFQKQLQNFINSYIQGRMTYTGYAPSILIIANYQPGTNVTTSFLAAWSQYVTAMQLVANYAQVGFLDLSVSMPQADTSGSGYYNTDGMTLNDFGHLKFAQLVFDAITDTSAGYLNAMNKWYTALSSRASAPAKWMAIGDSVTEGQGASTFNNRWVTKTQNLLRANYPVLSVPGGTGYKPGGYNVYGPDSPWGTWYSSTSGTFSQNDAGAGPGYRLTYLQQGASRTYPFFGTDIDVWVYGGGGTLTYSIDGGTASNVATTNNGATTISSKTGLTRGQHTITVSTSSAGGASFSGFMIYDGDRTKGIQVYESAHSGSKTSLYLSDLTNFLNNVTSVAPQLITIDIGANDAGTDNVSTVTNSVMRLIGALADLPNQPSIVMIAPYYSTNMTMVSAQSAYNEAYKIASKTVGGTYIDFASFLPVADTSGTGYFSTDGVHANDSGQALVAQNVIAKLSDTRITPASAGTVLATETWTVPNGSSWPSQWAVTTANGGTIDVQNGMGRVITPTANYSPPGSTYLTGMPAVSDTEILMDFTVPNVSIEQYSLIGARIQTPTWNAVGDPTTGYIFNVYPSSNGIEVLLSGPFTSLQSASYTFASGVTYSVRWQLIGSRTKVRIWPKANAEPSTWNIDTSGANITTPGKVAVFSESGGSGSAQMYYDNLTVIAPLQTGKVYIGNQLRPLGYIGSQPIKAVYIGPNKVQ